MYAFVCSLIHLYGALWRRIPEARSPSEYNSRPFSPADRGRSWGHRPGGKFLLLYSAIAENQGPGEKGVDGSLDMHIYLCVVTY